MELVLFNKELRKWVLLDSESTTDIFCDRDLLYNVRRVDEIMKLDTNGGVLTSDMKGTLKNYGDVWLNELAITNILALCNVVKKYKVTFDSTEGNEFLVHKPDGKIMKFKQHECGLYYHEVGNKEFCMVTSVSPRIRRAFLTDSI